MSQFRLARISLILAALGLNAAPALLPSAFAQAKPDPAAAAAAPKAETLRAEIYKLLDALAEQGRAIVMISSELPEILRMSHRVLVMCEGRLTGEFPASQATQEKIMQLATQRESMTLS